MKNLKKNFMKALSLVFYIANRVTPLNGFLKKTSFSIQMAESFVQKME